MIQANCWSSCFWQSLYDRNSRDAASAFKEQRGCSKSAGLICWGRGRGVNRLLSNLSGEARGRCMSVRGWAMILHCVRPVVSFIRSRSVNSVVSRLYHADKVAAVGSQPDLQSPVFQVGHEWSLGLKLLQPAGSRDSSASAVVHVVSLCTTYSTAVTVKYIYVLLVMHACISIQKDSEIAQI